MEKLERMWAALRQVRSFEFAARSRNNASWTGNGMGAVIVEHPDPASIVFHESGRWEAASGNGLDFRNVYRWSRFEERIRLEHLRFGENHPVYLFDLVPDTDATWSSVAPHLCRDDEYAARLELLDSGVSVNWKITGPAKDEDIRYHYRFETCVPRPTG